ncbi:hypothetical protein O3G_MSEX008756 [Manduca sexta]|uniref:Uncharacterized protein n=1 Tax=Manduca sexta TaxID=7130 RepID=A0A921ZBD3_MANSE|nr:hypothetical protein O3G_MSEX008756 [Manduca sexta]
MLEDIEHQPIEVTEESREGFAAVGKPTEDIITKTETITENNVHIKRHTTITTIVQEFHNIVTKTKRTKTTIRTVTEDEYPDSSVVKKTSEKVSVVDDTLMTTFGDDVESSVSIGLEDFKDLIPEDKPEETETIETEEIKDKGIIIQRTIVTRIVKTKYSDKEGTLKKVKIVTTVTTTDQYPDGAKHTTVNTSISITDIEVSPLTSESLEEDIAERDLLKEPVTQEYAPKKEAPEQIGFLLKDPSPETEVPEKAAPKKQVASISKDSSPEKEITDKTTPKEHIVPVTKEPSPEKEVPEKASPKEQVALVPKEILPEKEIPEKPSPKEQLAPISKELSPEKEVSDKTALEDHVVPVTKEPSPEKEIPEKTAPKEHVVPVTKEPSPDKEVPEKASPKEQVAPISKEPLPEREITDKTSPQKHVVPVTKEPSPEKEVPEEASPKEQVAPVSKEPSLEKEIPEKTAPKEYVVPVTKEPSLEKEIPEKTAPKEHFVPITKEPSPEKVPEKPSPKEQVAPISKEASPEKDIPEKTSPEEHVAPVSKEPSPEKEIPEKTAPKKEVLEKASPKEQVTSVSKESSPEKEVPEKAAPKEHLVPTTQDLSPEQDVSEKAAPKEQVALVSKEPSTDETTPESLKIEDALRDLMPAAEPEIAETTETEEIKEKDIIIRRVIVTKIVRTKYADKQGILRKLKSVTTITTSDNFPDGSVSTQIETYTTLADIEQDMEDVIDDSLEGFEPIGKPKEDTTTQTEIIKEGVTVIKRRITLITIVQEFQNVTTMTKRTKTTIRTITEDEHPDGSVITKTSEKVSLVDESMEPQLEDGVEYSDDEEAQKIETVLKQLKPTGQPEESETIKTEEIKEKDIIIRRTIVTKTVKTQYADSKGVLRKIKIVTSVSTTDQYPDGSARATVDTSISVMDADVLETELDDKDISKKAITLPVRKESKELTQKDIPAVKETIPSSQEMTPENRKIQEAIKDLVPAEEPEVTETTITEEIKELEIIIIRIIVTRIVKTKYANKQGVLLKLLTVTTITTMDNFPDGSVRTQVQTSTTLTDIEHETDDSEENLEGFEPFGEPKEDTTTKTEIVKEGTLVIKRKITVITIVQEFQNVTIMTKRTKTIVRTITEDEYPDGSVTTKTSEKVSLVDKSIEHQLEDSVEYSGDEDATKIEAMLKDLIPADKPEEVETIETEEIKQEGIIIRRTIVTRIVRTRYADITGVLRKLKTVTRITITDQYPDGSARTTVDTQTFVKDIETPEDLEKEVPKKELPLEKSVAPVETQIEKEEPTSESIKIEAALKDLVPLEEPEITETTDTEEIKEKEIIIRRSIITRIVKTKYADKQGVLKKLKIVTTVTTTDNYPDGSARTQVETSTTLTDIEHEAADVIEESLEGFEPLGSPTEETTTETVTVSEDGIIIHRKITITTTIQEYQNVTTKIKRTKTTTKTVTEDEHPDGSVVTKTSEKVSLVDEYLEKPHDDDIEHLDDDERKIEAALSDLVPEEKPEEIESTTTEEIREKDIIIRRTISTKIIKTKYSDTRGVLRKVKTVTTVTTTDQYPDGSARTTVDTSTSVTDIEVEELPQVQDLKEFSSLEDKTVSVDSQQKMTIRDGKEVQQIITTTTTKEILASADGSKKKIRTTTEVVTETELPTGVTEVTKDVKVSVADYGIESFDENLSGYAEIGDPEEHSTSETETVVENGINIIRKTTVTTIRQEFENALIRSRKIKTIVKTIVEDEHPDGTVITKKSEKVSIADVFLKTPGPVDYDESEPPAYIDDNEIVEDTTEDSDVKHEIIQQGSITIKRTITTKTKRETLASSDKNIKRVRTTVETTTVDEFPDGSTETTKDVKITISEFQKTSGSDLQAALQGLSSTGKVKTSVDKKTNIFTEDAERIQQTVTKYVTKEELKNNETSEIAVKTVTETITENARDDGTIETTKDVKTQITYLPIGTGLDDWSPEELEEIEKQPLAQEDKVIPSDLPHKPKEESKLDAKPKKQRSPVGEVTTDTETYTKVIKEGDNEITQTITVVTTKEVISSDKIKITVETTTVSKGSDGVTKTTKSTKTTIAEYDELIDTGESVKSFSKLSSRTGDMRSSSAASDDLDHHGISSPPSDISSRAATHAWGTESSGMYYSDDDGQGSPSSTKSQIAHSPRSNLSFELDTKLPSQRESSQEMLYDKHDSFMLHKDPMTTSIYGQFAEDDSCTSSSHSETKTVVHSHDSKSVSKMTEDFLTHEKQKSEHTTHSKSDTTFLQEADEHFEKAIEEHKKVSGSDVISSITAKYELDKRSQSSSSHTSSKEDGVITLKDIKSESKKMTESSSTSKESKTKKSDTDSKDPIASWGKPLGLPSPIMPPTQSDGKSTPKKQTPSSTVLNKNKLNQEKSKEAKRASESPSKKKAPAPVYMELTYVPHHGNSYYSAIEFFKRVRARYYVFSGTEPSKEIYNALLDAKKTWEDKDLEVTIIPTYDTDVLGYWVTENEEALEKYKIDLSPSASRCTINLQDHETSCAAYRLEF